MNAKKIMGAVLVALLAAALFVGAGAAADTTIDGKTVFLYQNLSTVTGAGDYTGTWNYAGNTFTISATTPYVANENLPEGKYTRSDDTTLYLKKPTGSVTANVMRGTTPILSVIGGTAISGSTIQFNVDVPAALTAGTYGLIFTSPAGIQTTIFNTTTVDFAPGASFPQSDIAGTEQEGTWKVQALFKTGTAPGTLVSVTPAKYLYGADVYTFTIGTAKIGLEVSAEEVINGNTFTVTITGEPGDVLYLKNGTATIAPGQVAFNNAVQNSRSEIQLGNDGKATVALTTHNTGDLTLEVYESSTATAVKADAIVEVVAGTITVKADADSYYIGNDIKLSGTNTVGGTLYFYIEGTNVIFTELEDNNGDISVATKVDKTWEKTIKGSDIQGMKLDAGTYTIYVSTEDPTQFTSTAALPTLKKYATSKDATYVTAGVALKQPFISVTEAPDVVVQDTELKVVGTAEATTKIAYYIFGTNKFAYANNSLPYNYVVPSDTISVKDNTFTIKVEMDKDDFAAGQYFMVIQHPMYDGEFNIWAEGTNITRAATETTAAGTGLGAASVVFDVTDRQKANAAQALCDELDSQSIDDMYVKLSFIIAQGTSTINPIPSEITKGTQLTVSGTTNGGEGTLVTVEMLSTAFAAVPKETVGSASFISIVTKTDKDGNWEVTFDTTGLNVDEYTVSAAVEGFGTSTTKVNVIEGAPTEQPTTQPTETQPTEQPTQTEAPKTPGFGALAALAGLGAVAVLLLRRE